MPENKTGHRQALGAMLDARAREVLRHTAHPREHLLLGAITKRPS